MEKFDFEKYFLARHICYVTHKIFCHYQDIRGNFVRQSCKMIDRDKIFYGHVTYTLRDKIYLLSRN